MSDKNWKRVAKNIFMHTTIGGEKIYALRYYHKGRHVMKLVGPVSLHQAKEALRVRRGDLARGKFDLHKRKLHPFSAVVTKYRQHIAARGLQGNGYESNICTLEAYFGSMNVENITATDINAFITHRQAAYRRYAKCFKDGRTLGETARAIRPATINQNLATLSKMLSLAKADGWLAVNPVSLASKPKEHSRKGRCLTAEEEARLLDACAQAKVPYLKSVVVMALHTGCRLSEILTLRWEQISFLRRDITLSKTKNDKGRMIVMNAAVFETLSAQHGGRPLSAYVSLTQRTSTGRWAASPKLGTPPVKEQTWATCIFTTYAIRGPADCWPTESTL